MTTARTSNGRSIASISRSRRIRVRRGVVHRSIHEGSRTRDGRARAGRGAGPSEGRTEGRRSSRRASASWRRTPNRGGTAAAGSSIERTIRSAAEARGIGIDRVSGRDVRGRGGTASSESSGMIDGGRAEAVAEVVAGLGVLEQAVEQLGRGGVEDERAGGSSAAARRDGRRQEQQADGGGHLGAGPLHEPVRQERRRQAVLGRPGERGRRDDGTGAAGCRATPGPARATAARRRTGPARRRPGGRSGRGRASASRRRARPRGRPRRRGGSRASRSAGTAGTGSPTRPRPAGAGPRPRTGARGRSPARAPGACSRSSRVANSISVAEA